MSFLCKHREELDYQITDANGFGGTENVSWYYVDDLTTVVGILVVIYNS